jgi:hypothetical protein
METIVERGSARRGIGFAGERRIPALNVSEAADAEFLRLLENADPDRHARLMKNMRRDNPDARMTEDQALTNFMLGLPTGQFRFEVVAGSPAPEPVRQEARITERLRFTRRRVKQARAGRLSSRTEKNVLAAD